MIPDDKLQALSGMFADVEPKPVVVQTPEPVEESLTIGFPSGATITARHSGKSAYIQEFMDSIQKMGRSLKSMPGGIGVVFDDLESSLDEKALRGTGIRFLETGTNGNHDGLHYTLQRRIFLPKIPKNKAEIEAFKTKSRGRLIGRKGW